MNTDPVLTCRVRKKGKGAVPGVLLPCIILLLSLGAITDTVLADDDRRPGYQYCPELADDTESSDSSLLGIPATSIVLSLSVPSLFNHLSDDTRSCQWLRQHIRAPPVPLA